MTYEELYSLFLEGKLDELIVKGEIYSLEHPEDAQALLLQAVAYHDSAMQEYDHEEGYQVIQNHVIPILRKALAIEPNDSRLLYNFLSYPLENEYNLMQVGRLYKHITEDNKAEFIACATRLSQLKNNEIYGFDFLVKIYESLQDDQAQLTALDQLLSYIQNGFTYNRELRDTNYSVTWPKKIFLLDRMKSISGEELTQQIEEGLVKFDSSHNYIFLDFADIAKENNRLDLALKILLKWIYGEAVEGFYTERLQSWYQLFKTEFNNGFRDPQYSDFILTIERFQTQNLGINEDQYYQTALELEKILPADFYIFFYQAVYLYEQERFEEALPLFEKALAIKPNSRAWRRYLECCYHLGKDPIDNEFKSPNEHPSDLYNQGVLLGVFCDGVTDEKRLEYKKYTADIYTNSWKNFKRYFENDAFETSYLPMEHTRAMCGNNLANILYEYFQEYDRALAILDESLTYSVFPELISTKIKIYELQENYEAIITTASRYLEDYYDGNPSFYNLSFESAIIHANYQLGEHYDLEELKTKLFEFYDTIDYSALDNYQDIIVFDNTNNYIETMMYQLLEDETEEEKAAFYEDIATQYPKQPNAHYQLMQIYNTLEDFPNCEKATIEYLSTKKKEAYADSNLEKVHFLMVKSKAYQGKAEDAIAYFEEHYSAIQSLMDAENWVYMTTMILPSYVNTGRNEHVFELVNSTLNIYRENEVDDAWSYEQINISKAIALYNSGKNKEALTLLDELMQQPDYDPVLEDYKKEWKPKGFFSKFGF